MVTTNSQVSMATDAAIGGRKLSIDQLEQSWLSSSVGTDKRDSGVKVDTNVDVLVHQWLAITIFEAHVLDHDDWGRNLPTVRDRAHKQFVDGDFLRQTSVYHLTKSLLFTLSLTSEFGTAVTETSNVVLRVSNFVLLPLVLFHLVLLQLCSCAKVRVIVSSIILELPFVNMNDVSTDTVGKILRVRDED